GAFLLLAGVTSAVGLLAAAVLIGVAGAADSVAPGAVLGDVVGGRGGTVVAVFQMSGDLGAVLGPVLAGVIADSAGYSTTFVVVAAVCAASALPVLGAPETLVRRSEPVDSPSLAEPSGD
ncbi:MAG: MFS transporter, partial [Actinobacteria bacterium]|nr:MFS transporter [Actinomycetota bacterium]